MIGIGPYKFFIFPQIRLRTSCAIGKFPLHQHMIPAFLSEEKKGLRGIYPF
jgi:hypothetical protein